MKRELVCQSNDLIKAQYKLPLMAKKVFAKAVARLNPKGLGLVASFNASEFAEDFEIEDPNLPQKIIIAANECMHMALTIERPGKTIICRVFHYVEIDNKTKDIVIYFADPLKEELLDLKKNYTRYLVENIIDLSNVSHIRLFEALKSKQNLKNSIWVVDFHDFMIDLDLPKSYYNFDNLKKKLLEPAQRELKEHTELTFTFEPVKSGRRIVKIKFQILKSNREMESEPVTPKKQAKPGIKEYRRGEPAYMEPTPNYQPAQLPKIEPLTKEQLEANRIAREKFKPVLIKEKELIAVE